MITVDTERVNAIITDDTEKVRYIDYISELSQALGLTDHTVPNDVAWYPSHLPAPRPMQKKQARKEWHQEALECGYYTNSGTPYATSKSLLEQLKYRLENTTAYRHGQGGADYQYLYDTIINNPLHRVFTGQPIGRFNSTAVVFYDFLRTIGCLTIRRRAYTSTALEDLLPATMFADESHSYWWGNSIGERYGELGVDDLLPVEESGRAYEEDFGAPDFTVEDLENLDVGKIMDSPVGRAYTNGFANLRGIIANNKAAKEALEVVIPLLTPENQETE